MYKNQIGFVHMSVVLTVIIVGLIGGIGWFVWQNQQQSQTLSVEQIAKKFDCNRITADVRNTDVFCGNPKFYNNPDSVTYDDYYKILACDERMKNGLPAETAKTNDPGYYNAYYDCKDPAKLDNLRLEFIESLKKIKQEKNLSL